MSKRTGATRAPTPIDHADVAARPAPPPARLAYRVAEVAALLGVHRRTVLRAIDKGELQSTRALGVRLIDAESVRKLFQPEVANV